MQVAPAFQSVEATVKGVIGTFNSLMGQIRGPGFTNNVLQGQLNSALGTFQSQNAWAAGMDQNQLMQALLTITPEDFANYAAAGKGGNLNEIFSLYAQLHNASQSAAGVSSSFSNAASSVNTFAEDLARAKEALRDWALGKMLGSESPMLPQDRLDLAAAEYVRVRSSGDVNGFQGAADAYLEQLRSFYGSSEEYTTAFSQIMEDAALLGGFSLSGLSGDPIGVGIDRMRTDVVAELQAQRADSTALRVQIATLINVIDGGNQATTAAAERSGAMIASAVENAVRVRA
jgi:hypothetical protein